MKATTYLRWAIALVLLALITSNLLAQSVASSGDDAYPAPQSQPTTEPYPWETTESVNVYLTDPYPAPPLRSTTDLHPGLPTLCPTMEPWQEELIQTRTLWPVIPAKTPTTNPTTFAATETRLRLLSPELYEQHRGSITPTPTRDPEWEAEFEVVRDRQPDVQDVKDRQWSLTFLAQTGRPPTQAEWEDHYYDTNRG